MGIGLWPFSFWTENEVRRLIQEGAIEFYNRGIVFSGGSLKNNTIESPLEPIDAVSIEIWLQPAKEPQNTTLNFLCFNDNGLPPPVAVGQWQSSLIIHARDEGGTYQKQYNQIRLQHAMPQGETRFISITSGSKGTTIYLDGKRAGFFPDRRLLINKKTLSPSFLVLGNDLTGRKPWTGKIFGLSIYEWELSDSAVFQNFQDWIHSDYTRLSRQDGIIALYPVDEPTGQRIFNRLADRHHLRIPERFRVPRPLILDPPWRDEGFKKFKDLAINILGFIPFGFLGLAHFASITRPASIPVRLVLIVVLFGGLLSLAIELLQVFLPGRYSSLTDLICNTFGTAVGAFLFHLAVRKLPLLNRARAETA